MDPGTLVLFSRATIQSTPSSPNDSGTAHGCWRLLPTTPNGGFACLKRANDLFTDANLADGDVNRFCAAARSVLTLTEGLSFLGRHRSMTGLIIRRASSQHGAKSLRWQSGNDADDTRIVFGQRRLLELGNERQGPGGIDFSRATEDIVTVGAMVRNTDVRLPSRWCGLLSAADYAAVADAQEESASTALPYAGRITYR